MPATCYRCTALTLDPVGEPFGSCSSCSSFACRLCGNRLRNAAIFRCALCFPETDLLPSAGIPRREEPPSGPGGPGELGGGRERALFEGTSDFEQLVPGLAELSAEDRAFFHEGALAVLIERTRVYASDEVRRDTINAEVGWKQFDDEAEERRRREALVGAKLLARGIETAEAHETLRLGLLADALGAACWAIGVRAGSPEPVSVERLGLIADVRLRFAIGYAMPVVATG